MTQSYGDLRILQHRELGALRKLQRLPSWVPDYSVAQLPGQLWDAACDWKASGDEKWVPGGRSLEDPRLTVSGRCIGTVDKVALSAMTPAPSTVLWGSVFDLLSGVGWSRFVDARLLQAHQYPIDSGLEAVEAVCAGRRIETLPSPLEVLLRTVTRNILAEQSPAPAERLREEFVAFAAAKLTVGMKRTANMTTASVPSEAG